MPPAIAPSGDAQQYVPDEQAALRIDDGIPQLAPRHFVTARDVISLTGTTDPGAQLLLAVASQQLRRSDLRRRERQIHPERAAARRPDPSEFIIDVVQRSGFTARRRLPA